MTVQASRPESDLFIEYALRMTKGRMRFVGVASALLLMLAVATAFLLAIILGDHLVAKGLPDVLRALLRYALVLAELAMAAAMIVAPLARRINDLYVARLIEKHHPAFRNDLTAALQLETDSRVHRAPLAAIKRRAAHEVAETDVESSVTTRRVRQSAILFAVAGGLFLIYALIAPKQILPSLFRAMGADGIAAPTRTQFLLIEPNGGEVVLVGKPVQFTAQLKYPQGPVKLRAARNDGVLDAEGRLLALNEDTLTMAETAEGSRRYTVEWTAAAEEGRASFQMLCGDAASEVRKLTVLPVPAIQQIQVSLAWPAYTQRGVKVEALGHVQALVGTQVAVKATANLPVEMASLVFEKAQGDAVQMAVGNEREMTATFALKHGDRYRIDFKSKYPGIGGQSIWYDVQALEDAPPRVRLTSPTERVELAVNDVLRVAGEMSDDYGIQAAELVCKGPAGAVRLPIAAYRPPGQERKGIEATYPVNQIGQAGQEYTCHVEAKDFRPLESGNVGQPGLSESFVLVIKKADEQIEAQAKAAKEAADRQQELQKGAEGKDDRLANADDVKNAIDKLNKDSKLDKLTELLGKNNPNDPNAKQNDPNNPNGKQNDPNNPKGNDPNANNPNGKQNDPNGNQPGKQPGNPPAGNPPAGNPPAGNPPAGNPPAGNPPAGNPPAGNPPAGNPPAGNPPAGNPPAGNPPAGNPPGAGAPGAGAPGAGAPGAGAPGAGAPGAGAPGAGAPGAGAPGAGQPGAGQPGAGQPGAGQPGAGAGGTEGATGLHGGTAGGDPNSGSSKERGHVEDPTGQGVSPAEQARLEAIGRALDEAIKQMRDGKVDPKLLKDLGMTEEQFKAFVEEYTQKFGQVKEMIDQAHKPSGAVRTETVLPGDDKLSTGSTIDAGLGVSGTEKLSPDEIKKLNEAKINKVSPEYRKEVEAFFRTLSENANSTPPPAPKENK